MGCDDCYYKKKDKDVCDLFDDVLSAERTCFMERARWANKNNFV